MPWNLFTSKVNTIIWSYYYCQISVTVLQSFHRPFAVFREYFFGNVFCWNSHCWDREQNDGKISAMHTNWHSLRQTASKWKLPWILQKKKCKPKAKSPVYLIARRFELFQLSSLLFCWFEQMCPVVTQHFSSIHMISLAFFSHVYANEWVHNTGDMICGGW